jgi:iron complex outermembrane receptor protein
VAGVEYQNSNPIRQTNYDVDPYESQLNSRRHNTRTGMYMQDELQVRDDLLLSSGLRYDHNSAGDKDTINPRLGAIYHLSSATTVKALYGQAYRLPNAYELYYQIPGIGGQKTNPNLQTERIRSYEMVLEHRLSSASRVRLSAYRNKVSDLITLVQDPADSLYVFQNIRKATATGLEAALEQAWRNGTRLRTSYTWQRAKDDETGETLENAPRHLGKMNVSVPFYDNVWRAGFEALYVSERRTVGGKTGGYALSNLTLFSEKLAKNVEFSASVYNLFDRRYADPVGEEFKQDVITQDGRNIRIKLTYNY